MISIPQIRAARGLLGWSQTRLAEEAGLSLPTVKRYETASALRVSEEAIAAMRAALEAVGVIFVPGNGDGPGVRLRKSAQSHAELNAHIETLKSNLPEVDPHAKPSPVKAMKQLERAHGKNEIAEAKRKRAKLKGAVKSDG